MRKPFQIFKFSVGKPLYMLVKYLQTRISHVFAIQLHFTRCGQNESVETFAYGNAKHDEFMAVIIRNVKGWPFTLFH